MNDIFLAKINEYLTLALDACIGEARQTEADVGARSEQRYRAVITIVDGIIGIRHDLAVLRREHQQL